MLIFIHSGKIKFKSIIEEFFWNFKNIINILVKRTCILLFNIHLYSERLFTFNQNSNIPLLELLNFNCELNFFEKL